MFHKQRSLSLRDYKNPKSLKKKVCTISLKLILSNIVGALFCLTFGGSLAGTTSVHSVRSFSVLGRSGVERVGTVWLAGDFFGIINWRRLWEIRVISNCFIPETKGHTVQTRSMASTNQEIGNPPTVVEWQLQTLSTAIKRLTQQNKALILQNQALEVQIKHPQEHQVLSHDQRRSGHNHYPPFKILQKGIANRREK